MASNITGTIVSFPRSNTLQERRVTTLVRYFEEKIREQEEVTPRPLSSNVQRIPTLTIPARPPKPSPALIELFNNVSDLFKTPIICPLFKEPIVYPLFVDQILVWDREEILESAEATLKAVNTMEQWLLIYDRLACWKILGKEINKAVYVLEHCHPLSLEETAQKADGFGPWIEENANIIENLRDKGLHNLTTIPPELSRLTALRKLHLPDNRITDLPEFIGSLTTLQELVLSKNQLREIPSLIGRLTALTVLDLSCNPVVSLPQEMENLTALQYLNLSSIPMVDLEFLRRMKNLERLVLNGCNLTQLPQSIGSLPLQLLSICNNYLNTLPESIGEMTPLKFLYATDNLLTALPSSMSRLSSLEFLYLGNNHLTSVSESMGSMNLRSFDLVGNQLTDLPVSLTNLPSHCGIDIRNNPISSEKVRTFEEASELVRKENPLCGPKVYRTSH